MEMGSPDYPDDPTDLKPPSTVSLPMHGFDGNNSDSDDTNDGTPHNNENDPFVGYQQLNLEDDMPDDNVDDDDDDDEEDRSNVQEPATETVNPTADTEIACQVWNAPLPNELDIKIDSTKCDDIKSVMTKVQLGAIDPPEWAKHIPETKWIEELLQEVRRNKSIGSSQHKTNQISPLDTSDGPSSSK